MEVDGTDSESGITVGLGISGVEPLGSAIIILINMETIKNNRQVIHTTHFFLSHGILKANQIYHSWLICVLDLKVLIKYSKQV
jgi:hypothetical protein